MGSSHFRLKLGGAGLCSLLAIPAFKAFQAPGGDPREGAEARSRGRR